MVLDFAAVFEKETGEFIGQAGLFHKGFYDEQPDIELAYRLHKKYWGHGYATELAKALIRWAFENIKIGQNCFCRRTRKYCFSKSIIEIWISISWPTELVEWK